MIKLEDFIPGIIRHFQYSFTAHNHIVNDVRWSCDSSWLVSACDDKTVRLWQRGQTEAVLTIATKLHNLAEGDGPKKDKVQ